MVVLLAGIDLVSGVVAKSRADTHSGWLMLAGCAATKTEQVSTYEEEFNDPLENVNRKIFDFNQFVDRNAIVPAAKAYRAALPERRKAVGGMLSSMALTSFLTGVTEPIEFAFWFLAPLLYALHAVMTGLSMAVTHWMGMHLGFGFSAGLFDYVLNFSRSTRPWLPWRGPFRSSRR